MDIRTTVKEVLKKDKGLECVVNTLEESLIYIQRVDESMYRHLMEDLEARAYAIDEAKAVSIVRNMKPMGQQWSLDQIKDYTAGKGHDPKCYINWYLVMNMVYNDYYDTAKMYGLQGDVEFFYHLAKDFIDDPDARPFKVEKYFMQ